MVVPAVSEGFLGIEIPTPRRPLSESQRKSQRPPEAPGASAAARGCPRLADADG
jgi:hypothetical protein